MFNLCAEGDDFGDLLRRVRQCLDDEDSVKHVEGNAMRRNNIGAPDSIRNRDERKLA